MNNFREWLSDNLRYIMLICGILVVLVAAFFGVRAVSGKLASGRSEDVMGMDSVVDSVPGNNTMAGAVVNARTASIVEEAAGAAENVISGAEEPAGSMVKEEASSAVAVLMSSYYEAIGNQDISAVRELVDILPETKAAEISSERLKYSDVEVYTKPGYTEGSYVVYTTYNYSGSDDSEKLPGISQSYVKTEEDGSEKIVFSGLDAETQEYIDTVAKEADVVALVGSVRDEYNAARGERSGSSLSSSGSSGNSSAGTEQAETGNDDEDTGDDAEAYDDGDDEYNEEDYDEEDYDDDSGDEEESSDSYESWTGTAKDDVNVRSGPGFDYEVIGGLSEGEKVTITGEANGWYHINGQGLDGYVGHSWIN